MPTKIKEDKMSKNFREIEKLLSTEEYCEQLLENYEEKFDRISFLANALAIRQIKTQEQLKDALTELTGLYMQLHDVTVIIDTYKTGQEGKLNFSKVKELEKNGEKIVQAQLDKLISHEVHYLRRIRNIFAANRDRADKGIISCQSLRKQEKNANFTESQIPANESN
jgi:hypothetical protein